MNILRNLLLTVLAIALLCGLQQGYDLAAKSYVATQRAKFTAFSEPLVPGVEGLKLLSLGDGPLVADLLWLNTIQYFGAGTPYGKYHALGPMLDRVTQLDPKFEYPYEFGLVTLPYMEQTAMAITLGQRAQQVFPHNGLLTYYLASDYQLNLKDYKNAAKYYILASKQPGAPSASITLAATSLDKLSSSLGDRLVAAEFWKTAYDNAKNDDEKKRDYSWYQQLQIVYALESAAQTYHDKTGNYPASFQVMIDAGLIQGVPASPVNRLLQLNPSTGKVSFDQLAN